VAWQRAREGLHSRTAARLRCCQAGNQASSPGAACAGRKHHTLPTLRTGGGGRERARRARARRAAARARARGRAPGVAAAVARPAAAGSVTAAHGFM